MTAIDQIWAVTLDESLRPGLSQEGHKLTEAVSSVFMRTHPDPTGLPILTHTLALCGSGTLVWLPPADHGPESRMTP